MGSDGESAMPWDLVEVDDLRGAERSSEATGPYRFLIADGTASGRLTNMRFLEIDGSVEFDCPGLTLSEIVERFGLDRRAYYQIRGPNDAALAAGVRKG